MMMVKPRTMGRYNEELDTIPGPPGFGLYLNCDAVAPPSSRGKHVVVSIPPELMPALIKEAKRIAILERSKHLGTK